MIKVESITKTYGKQKALDEVSFFIGKGEIVGFLGPNGAGKSTMMKILTGYIQMDSGRAEISGIEVKKGDIASRYKIGYLPENNPLYTDMYVREYLRFVAGFYPVDHINARIEELIEITGLAPESHKKIGALSKGYRQRVGIAQALIPDPEVLILDEPTTGLDPNQIVEVRDLIKNLGKEKTVMLSTHIMQEVQAICERAIIINKGKIVADAPVSKLSQQLNKSFNIRVEFEDPIDEAKLRAIGSVLQIETSVSVYNIKASNDIRKEISRLAADNDWLILSMSLEKSSLEDVFRELTK
ncbi:gliding motility-associated ABC transporter ATP-binding subunit GldA [Saccharicrinis sp. FJH62]|uniref:gliding motility-associated ABC transporter ATP-binding subunit GldA n=1 Tax=Saccharicrinis sp. FJH62 TaxID=3344657 RepID=UPI0035D45649